MTDCNLLIIGDSHTYAWFGTLKRGKNADLRYGSTKLCHLGPMLAHNLLCSEGLDAGKWGKLIFQEIDRERPKIVLLVCGEIDIRTRALLYSFRTGGTIEEAMLKLAERVLKFARICTERYHVNLVIADPVGSAPNDQSYNDDFPTIGSEYERNFATASYSQAISELLSSHGNIGVGHISAFWELVETHAKGVYKSKECMLDDGCHLNLLGMLVLRKMLIKELGQYSMGGMMYPLDLPSLQDFNQSRIRRLESLAFLSNKESSFIRARDSIPVGGRFAGLYIKFPHGVIITEIKFQCASSDEWTLLNNSSGEIRKGTQTDECISFKHGDLGEVVRELTLAPVNTSRELYISGLNIEGVCFDPTI